MIQSSNPNSGALDGTRVDLLFRKLLGWLTGIVLFFMMVTTTIDVVARFVFSNPLPGTFELMEFSLAIVVFSALPLVTWDRGHITVSLFEGFFKAGRERLQQIIVMAASAVAMAIISARMWDQGNQLNETGATTGFLLWPRAPIAYFMGTLAGVSFMILVVLFIYACRGKKYPEYSDNQ